MTRRRPKKKHLKSLNGAEASPTKIRMKRQRGQDSEEIVIDEDGQIVRQNQKKHKAQSVELEESAGLRSAAPSNATVFRDKSGKIVSEGELKRRNDAKKAKEEASQKLEWGKGLVQVKKGEEELKELIQTARAPLARYEDDELMNMELRAEQRWGDPMLKHKHKIKKSDSKQGVGNISTRPMYKGTPFSNRFGILPGYRWDGVDRTNGWEKRRTQIMLNSSHLAALNEDYGAPDD
eukprot:TRINITY_DN30703_c0_g1_i1.p1 TRINITY_DN30703_c0_g1~~TRINITY_DN30703_c0_g1_i1.p1  ORF type:complete len:235 (+),score=76.00 TRINITY_DN30703_c0_g1_i1:255-959(+)